MTAIVGNEAAQAVFLGAAASQSLHHAWLISGSSGVGKAGFAKAVAARMLANAVDPMVVLNADPLPEGSHTASMIAAGAHPDFRVLDRLPKDPEKPGLDIARSIKIEQVRALQPMLATKPTMSQRRIIVIDAADDLELSAANAILKNLEEPPTGTIFLLIGHSAGRLLPTIRSRCRLLRFDPLNERQVANILRGELPEVGASEIEVLVRAGAGSPGRALGFAGLDLASLEREMRAIAAEGDRSNVIRAKLSRSLSVKSAQPRYEAFLARTPSLIAELARIRSGEPLRVALNAYADAQKISSAAVPQSYDVAPTVFEMGGLLARLAD